MSRYLLILVLVSAACESPEDRLERLIDEAAACEEGDTCVIAGATDCSCGEPVNAEQEDEVNAAAEGITCCDLFGACMMVECAAVEHLRCEEGRCAADRS